MIAAGVAIAALALFFRPKKELSFEDRTLYQWLELHAISNDPLQDHKAEAAVKAIGTNAFPILVEWLDDRTPGWQWQILRKFPALDGSIADRVIRGPDRRSQYARLGFKILQDEKAHAIAHLEQMLRDDKGTWSSWKAAEALGDFGPDGIVAIGEVLKDQSRMNRFHLIGFMRVIADSNPEKRAAVIRVLGPFRNDPYQIIRHDATNLIDHFEIQARIRKGPP